MDGIRKIIIIIGLVFIIWFVYSIITLLLSWLINYTGEEKDEDCFWLTCYLIGGGLFFIAAMLWTHAIGLF